MGLLSRELVMEKLRDIQDPELQMNIVELGLIYDVTIEEGRVQVLYTLTTPGCPLGPVIVGQIRDALTDISGVKEVEAKLTFSPPWDPRTMASEDAKMQLGVW